MSEWIDRLKDLYLNQRADDHIELEKRQIAAQYAATWQDRILDRLKQDVAYFAKAFNALGKIDGPKETPYGWVVGSNQYPHCKVYIKFDGTILSVTKTTQQSIDAKKEEARETVFLKASIDGNTWMECGGQKMLTPESVSEYLLTEVMVAVAVVK